MNEFKTLLGLLSTHEPRRADAIVLMAGDRFHRINKAAELYHDGHAPYLVVTSSADNWEYGSAPSSKLVPELTHAGVPIENIIQEETSPHTRAEADSALHIAKEHDWKTLIVVTTKYHLPRTYLTWLKAMKDAKYSPLLIMIPALGVPEFKQQSEGELFAQEMERIMLYQQKGDVATYADGVIYLSRG